MLSPKPLCVRTCFLLKQTREMNEYSGGIRTPRSVVSPSRLCSHAFLGRFILPCFHVRDALPSKLHFSQISGQRSAVVDLSTALCLFPPARHRAIKASTQIARFFAVAHQRHPLHAHVITSIESCKTSSSLRAVAAAHLARARPPPSAPFESYACLPAAAAAHRVQDPKPSPGDVTVN